MARTDPVDSYGEIFEQRGHLYHQAMLGYPRAREQEFLRVVQLADIEESHRVCDVPSGGGYLRSYVDPRTTLIPIETSRVFARLCRRSGSPTALLSSLDALPLRGESIDRVVNVAGLHHVDDKLAFFEEAARVLKVDGTLCIADVGAGSKVAAFLDAFVDKHNPMGHKGSYLDDGFSKALESVGFRVAHHALGSYHWRFDTLRDMTTFCRLLFGLVRVGHEEIVEGIEQYLGYGVAADVCHLDWELLFCKAIKLK
jgi:SAM-dependent methyltransferase